MAFGDTNTTLEDNRQGVPEKDRLPSMLISLVAVLALTLIIAPVTAFATGVDGTNQGPEQTANEADSVAGVDFPIDSDDRLSPSSDADATKLSIISKEEVDPEEPKNPSKPVSEFDIEPADIVGYVTVGFEDNGVRREADLADTDAKYQKPLGTLVAMTKVPFKTGDTIASVTLRLLKAKGIDASYTGSDKWNFSLSSIKLPALGWFGEFSAGRGSGWMVSANDTFVDIYPSERAVDNGDVITWQYSCQSGKDIGNGLLDDSTKAVVEAIDSIGEVTLNKSDAIQSARRAYDALTDAQKANVENYSALTTAESAYKALLDSANDSNAGNAVSQSPTEDNGSSSASHVTETASTASGVTHSLGGTVAASSSASGSTAVSSADGTHSETASSSNMSRTAYEIADPLPSLESNETITAVPWQPIMLLGCLGALLVGLGASYLIAGSSKKDEGGVQAVG